MRMAVTSLLLTVSLTTAAYAQNSEQGDTISWSPDSSHSRQVLVLGSKARAIVTAELTVGAVVKSTDGLLRLEMHFRNTGEQTFDVIPETFTLAVVKPAAKAKVLAYVSPKQLAKKIEQDAAWATIAVALAGAAETIGRSSGTTTSTTSTSGRVTASTPYGGSAYGTYNGVTTTTTHDSDAAAAATAAQQQRTSQTVAQIVDAAEARKIRETTGSLLSNTVFPGNSYAGVVHFKREKRATLMLLRVPVGGRVFEFPLEMPRE